MSFTLSREQVDNGFVLSPNPAVDGINSFSGADEATAEAARDLYFANNPDQLLGYDANQQKLIVFFHGDVQYFQNRVFGSWEYAINTATGEVMLNNHSATEMNDIISAGSGAIITDAERTALSNALTNSLAEDNILIGNGSDVATETPLNELNLPVILSANNGSGATLTSGQVVDITGEHNSGKPIVGLASNNTNGAAIGLVSAPSLLGEDCFIVTGGELKGLNTSTLEIGDVYVGVNGALTQTKPIGTAEIQKIGVVSRVHASNGAILVIGAGRANALPNLSPPLLASFFVFFSSAIPNIFAS